MSDFPQPPMPPGYGPIGYSGPQAQAPSPRPTVVTVLAIIGIVWAVWGILAGLYTLAANAAALQSGHMPFSHAPLFISQGWIEFTLGLGLVHLAFAVLLLAASIASLRLTGWGRRGMVWWSWVAIVLAVVGVVATFSHKDQMVQAMQTQIQAQQRMNPGMTPQMQQQMQGINQMTASMMSTFFYVGIFCPLITLIFPIWILATFNTPRVKSAFGEPAA
jgi:hypothetical protein